MIHLRKPTGPRRFRFDERQMKPRTRIGSPRYISRQRLTIWTKLGEKREQVRFLCYVAIGESNSNGKIACVMESSGESWSEVEGLHSETHNIFELDTERYQREDLEELEFLLSPYLFQRLKHRGTDALPWNSILR